MASLTQAAEAGTRSPWLAALVANIQDAIVVLDGAGQVVFESPSATGLLGTADGDQRESALGLHRIHPEERDTVIRSFERTIALPGSVARATYRFQRGDGGWQHLEAVAKNLLDHPELRGVLITLRDVTARIRALEEAERAGNARDEFLSRMSHELRTPLHAVLGWAQILQAHPEKDVREAAGQITGSGDHLLRLVDEALDLAAVREGRITLEMRPVEVDATVAEAIDIARPIADRRDVKLRVLAPATRGMRVVADRSRLRQVLINLLSNAVKYNRYAGDVVVRWSLEGDAVRLSIRDTGPGIPDHKLQAVFERFERFGMEATEIEGSGLGLAISRRLVEMMNGTIGVESRRGEGAEFWIRLASFPRWTVAEAGPTTEGS